MRHSPLVSALLIALVLHVAGLVAVSRVWRGFRVSPVPSIPPPIFVRLVPVELPPEPVPLSEPALHHSPPQEPEAPPVPLPVLESPPPPLKPVVEKIPTPPKGQRPPSGPVTPGGAPVSKKRLSDSPTPAAARSREQTATQKPKPGPFLLQATAPLETPGGNVPGPALAIRENEKPPEPIAGREAGAGTLFERGDVAVIPGPGTSGGSGGPGSTGPGLGIEGSGPQQGGVRAGTAGQGPGEGLTGNGRSAGGGSGSGGGRWSGTGGSGGGTVRPLGGYQVKPRYPESARRRGIEGTVLLKIQVTKHGRVEAVHVCSALRKLRTESHCQATRRPEVR